MHRECAEYAIQVCPYLSTSTMEYSKNYDPAKYDHLKTVVTKRPDYLALYVTRGYKLEPARGSYIFRANAPKEIEWRASDGKVLSDKS